jgi:muramoyltetrapeptide carboxypeptidase
MTATRFGRPLPEGGTIGVCAPSGPYYNASDVLRPKEWLEGRGYRVRIADGTWAQDDYVAGTPRQRADDINDLFADPEVDVIQVLWGGTGAIQVLEHLDFGMIAEHPKALMGYSDITNLHVALLQETGLATFHGPGFGSMGSPERQAFTWDSAFEAFTKGGVGPVPDDPDDPYRRTIAPGKITAPLVGGNLWTMTHLLGTPWEPTFEGAILFWEEVHTPAYQLEVLLEQLRLAGKLAGVAGVVVGELVDCDWSEQKPEAPRNRSIEDVLERHLAPLGVPVLYRLPLGHGKHLASVPLGVQATLDADAKTLIVDQPGVA